MHFRPPHPLSCTLWAPAPQIREPAHTCHFGALGTPPLLHEPAYTCRFGQIRTEPRRPYLRSLWCNLQAPHPLSCTLWAPAPLLCEPAHTCHFGALGIPSAPRARIYVSLWANQNTAAEAVFTITLVQSAGPPPTFVHFVGTRASALRARTYVSLWRTGHPPLLREPANTCHFGQIRTALPRRRIYMPPG